MSRYAAPKMFAGLDIIPYVASVSGTMCSECSVKVTLKRLTKFGSCLMTELFNPSRAAISKFTTAASGAR